MKGEILLKNNVTKQHKQIKIIRRLPMLNYENSDEATHKHPFSCVVQKYMYAGGHGGVNCFFVLEHCLHEAA
jgi:hypothetical protein